MDKRHLEQHAAIDEESSWAYQRLLIHLGAWHAVSPEHIAGDGLVPLLDLHERMHRDQSVLSATVDSLNPDALSALEYERARTL